MIHDWGPIGADPIGTNGLQGGAQLNSSFAAFTKLYGDSDTPGRTAVAGAFAGQSLPGFPGAGGVMTWRMGGSSLAAATIPVTSVSGGTPHVLTLNGYYKGSRGNRITYSVDNDPSDNSRDRIRFYLDGVVQETYIYDGTGGDTITELVAVISSVSSLINAVAVVGGSVARLTQTPTGAPVSLAGGDDGSTVVSADHLAALSGLEYKQFGVISPFDLTDQSIVTAYVSWLDAQIAAGRPSRLVIGGAAAEAVDDAISRSASIADEHVVNVGCGTYHDDLLDKDLSTSQLAPRVAGILAAKGQQSDLTFSKIGGLHTLVGPADDEIQLGVKGGVVLIVPTSSADADVRLEKGVTTFTDPNVPTKPLDVYSDSRLIGIMDNYIVAMKEWGDDNVVGQLPVNDDTRNLVRGQARTMEDVLQTAGLILPANANANPPIPAPWVIVDDPGDPTSDQVPYTFGWVFAKTTNQIIGQGSIS
jgi:hypothetical protein